MPPAKRARTSVAERTDDTRAVIFCHPGVEANAFWPELVETEAGRLKVPLWATEKGDCRYYFQQQGRTAIFDEGVAVGEAAACDLRFWAEWSGPALVTDENAEHAGSKEAALLKKPMAALQPLADPESWSCVIVDNDPSVLFGFNYTLCKQHSRPEALTSLPAGSLVLFGSAANGRTAKGDRGYFVLDTCFVVGEAVEAVGLSSEDVAHGRRGPETRKSEVCLSDPEWSRMVGRRRIEQAIGSEDVPAATRAAWEQALRDFESAPPLGGGGDRAPAWIGDWPTKGSKGPYLKTLYTGATFAEREHFGGCFSFVPATVSAQGAFMPRPKIQLSSTAIGEGKGLDVLCNGLCSQLVASKALGVASTVNLWQSIVDQVREQGFELATWVAPPAPMPPTLQDAIKRGIPIPEIGLAESDLGAVRPGLRVVDRLWSEDPHKVWVVEETLAGPGMLLKPLEEAEAKSRGATSNRFVSLRDHAQRDAIRVYKACFARKVGIQCLKNPRWRSP